MNLIQSNHVPMIAILAMNFKQQLTILFDHMTHTHHSAQDINIIYIY